MQETKPREPKIHLLKTHPEPFQAVLDGSKTAEYRFLGDRTFRTGDLLVLQEWNPIPGIYTGREVQRRVSRIDSNPSFGFPPGYGMLSLQPVPEEPTPSSG